MRGDDGEGEGNKKRGRIEDEGENEVNEEQKKREDGGEK